MKNEASVAARSRIGIVGLGRMGSGIASRLKESGSKVHVVYDRQFSRAEQVGREVGAIAAKSLAQVTASADIIITVVSDDAAMDAIFSASGDSLLVGAKGRIFINCATVTPQVHVDLEPRLAAQGAQALEACMAGSIDQARGGTLFLICGGNYAAFQSVYHILAQLGSIRFVGETGQAAQLKILVNMVMNANTAILAEALGLGEALGLDLAVVCDVFDHTGAKSKVLETDGADMIARDHEVYFSAAHAAKDSGIALQLARHALLAVPLAELTKQRFDTLVQLGFGESDKSVIAELCFKGRGAADSAAPLQEGPG